MAKATNPQFANAFLSDDQPAGGHIPRQMPTDYRVFGMTDFDPKANFLSTAKSSASAFKDITQALKELTANANTPEERSASLKKLAAHAKVEGAGNEFTVTFNTKFPPTQEQTAGKLLLDAAKHGHKGIERVGDYSVVPAAAPKAGFLTSLLGGGKAKDTGFTVKFPSSNETASQLFNDLKATAAQLQAEAAAPARNGRSA